MLTIWGRTTSLNVQKVLWCCVELGLDFKRIDWAGEFGGNDDPAYRAMNPNGKVPTIRDGDTIVWESNSILRYLCTTRKAAHLLSPESARLSPESARRSEIERWMDWQLAVLNPSMTALLIGHYRTPPEKRNAAALETARKQAIEQWSIIEKWLEGRDYLAGPEFTLSDIGNGILAHRWHSYPIERPPLPRVKAWYERLAARPSFQSHVAGPVS